MEKKLSKHKFTNKVISFESYRDWEKVMQGDRDTFKRITEPLVPELLEMAGREIRYQSYLGKLNKSAIQPEDLVGETLIRAWEHRAQRPEGMGLKGWLMAVQRLTLGRIIAQEYNFSRLASVSLESPLPKEPAHDYDESFLEWYQPDDFNRWEDLIPDDLPTPEEMAIEHEAATYGMEPDEREAMYLYHQHQLPIQEVAYIIRRTVGNTVSMLEAGAQSYHDAK